MKKTYFSVFIMLLFLCPAAYSQSGAEEEITKNFFVDLGASYGDFQDTKYSDVKEGGMGGHFKLGYNNLKEGKHFWETGFLLNLTKENAETHDRGNSTVIYPNIYFKYLKGIGKKFYVGARIDAFDTYVRIYPNLNNNSTFATFGNHLYGSVLFKTRLNDHWQFKAACDLALIGIQNEGTGFAMSYSQNRIEKGGVDYQDNSMGNPYSYKYAEFKYVGNNLILKTEYSFMFKDRFSFSYNWEMRHFAVVSGYPTNWGMHNIAVRFNIIHRKK